MKVRPGEAGHRIVREAIDARSQAIVMPMPVRRPSGKVLSKTLEVVLGEAPLPGDHRLGSRPAAARRRAAPRAGAGLAPTALTHPATRLL